MIFFSFFSPKFNRTFYYVSNNEDLDQTPHYAASDLGLHFLPSSHKKDARLIWDKIWYNSGSDEPSYPCCLTTAFASHTKRYLDDVSCQNVGL